jgi:hypothetical protein
VGNRGEEAAEAALQMADWIHQLRNDRAGRSPTRVTASAAGERASRGHVASGSGKRASRSPVRLSQATRGPRRPHGTR